MNILFYSSIDSRSKDTESLMASFIRDGHSVFLLTQGDGGKYHEYSSKIGVKCYSKIIESSSTLVYLLKHAYFLIGFIRKNRIDVVFSHLEPAGFSSVIAQYFVKAKVFVCRHHVDEINLDSPFLGRLTSKLIYRMAKNIIVVSNRSKEYMVSNEGIDAEKIIKINLGYDFSIWPPINSQEVQKIRARLNGEYVFLCASRLVKSKRVHLVLELVQHLREKGYDIGLYILGKGEEEANLKEYAEKLSIADCVSFEGYVDNVLDYMSASDLFVHFSIIDSSAAITKEAGLAHTTVLVCDGVGDFSDYIVDLENGFIVDRDFPLEQAITKLEKHFFNHPDRSAMGEKLNKEIIRDFDIKNVYPEYVKLLQSL